MAGQQKLPSLWVWMLLIAALCPGAQYAYSKRAGSFRGRGTGNKAPPSQNRGLSKQGVKWAGAAAAGMLGGTGTGYGLGFLGKPKHGSGNNYGHKAVASEQDRQLYYQQDQRSFLNKLSLLCHFIGIKCHHVILMDFSESLVKKIHK
uniref:Shadow of prion protein 2 n=1 Tax=Oreochromis aureus TaxID=47969 RepID=A0A668TIH0_OREAU